MKGTKQSLITAFSCLLIVTLLTLCLVLQSHAAPVVEVFSSSGTSTWTAPAGVTSVLVEAWGGGGGGGGNTFFNSSAGGGGAGGQFARRLAFVQPGFDYNIVVGQGGAASTGKGGDGGASSFGGNLVVAQGGGGGGNNGGSGGSGSIVGGVGDVVFRGGHGAAGGTNGGAGGGGAGSEGAGGNASGTSPGIGSSFGGGTGGAGRTNNGSGNNGQHAGGGGGGGRAGTWGSDDGGSGAGGMVRLTYEVPPVVISIAKTSSDPTGIESAVTWQVRFSTEVTGVDAGDFVLIEAGGASGSSVTLVSGFGALWTVTADTGTSAVGTLGLNLVDNDSIIDTSGIPLGGAGVGNGNFIGDYYTLTTPAVVLEKSASTSAAIVGDIVTFNVIARNPFSESFSSIVVTDTFPAGMEYVTHVATAGSASITGQTLRWNIPVLASGNSVVLTIAVRLIEQGTLTNIVTSPGATSAAATVLALASAVTHFRMDEPVGSWTGAAGEVIDSGGTGLHGRRLLSGSLTATNIVDPVPAIVTQHPTVIGGFCNAASFDGNAIVEVADSPLFDYTTQLSASAWIYPTAYPSELYSILSNDVNYEFHINNSGRLYWWWQASTLTSAATIPLNQWTHIAITFDSRSGVRRQRIYINGVLDNNTNNWQGTLSPNNCNFYIGGDINTGAACSIIPGRNFRGMIDEVKLYSFELSQAEVLADMRLGRSCSGTFDHIRIEHNGVGSICAPERVTLKACLNPECTVLYPGTVTVNLSPTGWVGGGTFSFSGGITSRQISSSTAGGIVLGTSSISPVPAGVTRCFSGGTETCHFNFVEASCAFDAVEPGAMPQTPIFTKLSGVPFQVDVLALLTPSVLNHDFIRTVSVDLVDSTGSVCPSGSGLTVPTDLVFGEVEAGRKTTIFNYAGAADNVRVRIQDGESAPACSNDNFAIRPRYLTVSSAATNVAMSGEPAIKAGVPFELSVQAVDGYDGNPSINNSLVIGSPHAGVLEGAFTSVSVGNVSGNFSYNEVGHFGLMEHAVFDQNYTRVDQPDECTPDFSNILVDGKYGCYVGSEPIPLTVGSSGFGRFIPHHFEANANTPVFGTACGSFTYVGQPFEYTTAPVVTVSARNAAGGVTQNYTGDYWKLTNASLSGKSYSLAEGNLDTALLPAPDPMISDNGGGTGTLTFSSGGGLAILRNTPIAPFDAEIRLQINVVDSDGVTYPDNPAHFGQALAGEGITFSGGKNMRYGRLSLDNAHGSELLSLSVPLRAEHYNGSSFVQNVDDSCTPYADTHLLLGNYTGNLSAGDTTGSGSGDLISAVGMFSLSAPGTGNDGSVRLEYNLGVTGADLPWLRFDWEGDGGRFDPTARATFGIFKGNQRMIYMRESVW